MITIADSSVVIFQLCVQTLVMHVFESDGREPLKLVQNQGCGLLSLNARTLASITLMPSDRQTVLILEGHSLGEMSPSLAGLSHSQPAG